MFIGGGSASTAGGIKVTTFGLLGYVMWAEMRGHPSVDVGRRQIPQGNQRQALSVALLGIGLVVGSTFVLLVITPFTFDRVLFEAISAFATVGLTTGITTAMPDGGRVLLIVLMFAGRIGPLTGSGRPPGPVRPASPRHWLQRSHYGSAAAGTSYPWKGQSLASHKDPVVVIGLGRFGTALSMELAAGGTEVLGIDNRPANVQRLAGQLSQVITADSTDLDALREVGVDEFHRAVVAIGTDQQASILTTSLLAELGVDDIWAKATSKQHARILRRIGAQHVVSPEHDMGERVAHLVSGQALDYLELDEDWVLAKTSPPRFLVGIALGDSHLRTKHHVTVVSVKPAAGGSFTYADATTRLADGDQIVVAGKPKDVEHFIDALCEPRRRGH